MTTFPGVFELPTQAKQVVNAKMALFYQFIIVQLCAQAKKSVFSFTRLFVL